MIRLVAYAPFYDTISNMINCSQRNEEIDRNVFCDSACKIRFHRGVEEEPAEKIIENKIIRKAAEHADPFSMCKKHDNFKSSCGCK